MTLLPQELARADERRRVLELPTNDVRPLVQTDRQVTMSTNPTSVRCLLSLLDKPTGIDDRLRSGTNSHGLLKLRTTVARHPRHLGSESLHVLLLLLQSTTRNKHGEVRILHLTPTTHSYLHTTLLDLLVQELLNLLPNVVRPTHQSQQLQIHGSQNVATRHVVVVDQLRSHNHLRVPLREVLVLPITSPSIHPTFL